MTDTTITIAALRADVEAVNVQLGREVEWLRAELAARAPLGEESSEAERVALAEAGAFARGFAAAAQRLDALAERVGRTPW